MPQAIVTHQDRIGSQISDTSDLGHDGEAVYNMMGLSHQDARPDYT